ncbi:MAG TPA: amidoligase family protein [Polyangiales bacterium]|nr:amidoligase family protein [Polyangiales bacterium]
MKNEKGEMRKVGLEIELGYLTLERTLEIVRDAVGGEIVAETRTEGAVLDSAFGRFKVEVDSKPLKERSYLKPFEALGLDLDSPTALLVEDSVLQVAREFVPIEIVTPPIPWDRMQELDPLWSALRAAGAQDTRSSLLHAFGLHLNPEPPDFETETLLAIVRAFLLLEDWIVSTADTDLMRQIAPYIRTFPEPYRRKILVPGYQPDWNAFVDDYLEATPTRNRPLDLLPLLAHLKAPGLEQRVEDWPLVKARPTFHYRLPNCEIARADWTPAEEWNRWVTIERVANDAALLRELSLAYLETPDLPLRMQRSSWVAHVAARLTVG